MSPWGRSWHGCIRSQAVRTRAVDLCPGDWAPPQGDSQMTESQGVIACSEAVRQLWEYLDQAVSPEEQEKIERHLSFCRRCCGEVEFAKELRGLLGTGGGGERPPHVRAG